ncbi:MAG: hypothetical protein JWP81_2341 [Ferruginibacter sp.]|nr:hypothetical protein [Ferruginibacter sp.]
MKKASVIIALLLGGFITENAQAQAALNINIGSQPVWGPVGYDHVDYYYLPDIDSYYNVPTHQYYYEEGGNWIPARTLPARYNSYDINNGYKVVINEPTPYRRPQVYRAKYASFKGNHGQQIIRNSHDTKYYIVKGHPEHIKWKKEHKVKVNYGNNGNNGNGKGKGNGKGNNGKGKGHN